MGHDHGVGSANARHRGRLTVAFALVAVFFVVELVTALASSSLALLSDAGHMAADLVTLGAALLATLIAARPDRKGMRTYGSYRAEVFASGLAVLIMLGISVLIFVEAIERIGRPAEPASTPMLIVGALGLLINLVCMVVLRGGAHESLNVKGAYLEVLADAIGSVGVMVAAVLVMVTGDGQWDTWIALAISLYVAVRAFMLGREVIAVLGQYAPEGARPAEVQEALQALDDVDAVHDLHVWTLTSGMVVLSAHLVASADSTVVLTRASHLLRERFDIDHATLQVEQRNVCDEPSW